MVRIIAWEVKRIALLKTEFSNVSFLKAFWACSRSDVYKFFWSQRDEKQHSFLTKSYQCIIYVFKLIKLFQILVVRLTLKSSTKEKEQDRVPLQREILILECRVRFIHVYLFMYLFLFTSITSTFGVNWSDICDNLFPPFV